MKGRNLSALLTQRVRGPETLARGTPSPTQPKEPSRSPGFWQCHPSHSTGSYTQGSPTCELPRTGSYLPRPQSWDHNSLVDYMNRSDAV